jgi:branched-chain amino acid aminotransferase
VSTSFGRYLGPLAVSAEHVLGGGWREPRTCQRVEVCIGPAAGAVQYGLSAFEGLKAYRDPQGEVQLFRARAHARRLRASAARLCLPDVAEELFLRMAARAVEVHQALVPASGRGSLYLRPTLLATEESVSFAPAERHLLCFVVAPSPPPDARPRRLWVEEEMARACPGGLGAAKTGAGYAASMFGRERARRHGCDDALWLDGRWRRDVTETGTMNLFAVLGGTVVTPALDGSILAGVTRDAVLALLRLWQIPVEERPLAMDELCAAARDGRLRELFGVGTTAHVVPVDGLCHRAEELRPRGGPLSERLAGALADIQEGRTDDPFGWREPLIQAPARAL